MANELEILQTALEEKVYGWDAIRLIADQYGYEWTSLDFINKTEPISVSGIKRLIKEYSTVETTETTSDDVTAPLEPKNGPVELINQGVTVSPGQEDQQWYDYRREDGTTFRSFSQL